MFIHRYICVHIHTHLYVDIYAWKDCENNLNQQTSKKEIEPSFFCALAGAYISISMTKSKRKQCRFTVWHS